MLDGFDTVIHCACKKRVHSRIQVDNQPKESLTRKSLDQSMLYIFAYIITFVAPFAALAIPQSTTATN